MKQFHHHQMDTSYEDSIEIKLNDSKIDDKTYFVLPKTVEQENEKLVKMLTPNDEVDACNIKLSNDKEENEMYNKIESQNESTINHLNKSIDQNSNTTCEIKLNVSSNANDSLLQVSSIEERSTSQNKSKTKSNDSIDSNKSRNQDELNSNDTINNSKKTKINDDDNSQNSPKKLKSNNGDAIPTAINSQATSMNQDSSVYDETNLIKSKYFENKLNQSNDKQERTKAIKKLNKNNSLGEDTTSQNNDAKKIDSTKSRAKNSQPIDKNNQFNDNVDKITPNKRTKSPIETPIKNLIKISSIRPSCSTSSNTPRQSNDNATNSPLNTIRANNPSIHLTNTPHNQATWDRLDNWRKDADLSELMLEDSEISKNSNKNRFGKDGKSLKKSPKMILGTNTKQIEESSSNRKSKSKSSNLSKMSNLSSRSPSSSIFKSMNDTKTKAYGKKSTILPIYSKSIDSNQIDGTNSSNHVTMADTYSRKIRKVFDEELSFLGEDVREKVGTKVYAILKEAVYEGIKNAHINGLAKVKESFASKPLPVSNENLKNEKENGK